MIVLALSHSVGEQPGVGVYLTLLIIFSIVFIALTIVLVVLYMKWILTSIRLRREPNNNAELSTNSDATESNKSINNEQSGDIMPKNNEQSGDIMPNVCIFTFRPI